jgi:hypothetical protein
MDTNTIEIKAVINLPKSKEAAHEMLVIMNKLVAACSDAEAKAKDASVRAAMEPVSDVLAEIMFECEQNRKKAYA